MTNLSHYIIKYEEVTNDRLVQKVGFFSKVLPHQKSNLKAPPFLQHWKTVCVSFHPSLLGAMNIYYRPISLKRVHMDESNCSLFPQHHTVQNPSGQ